MVIRECDYCVFIHDGKSIGTRNEMEIAKKLNKPFAYHLVKDEGIDSTLEIISIDNLFDNEEQWPEIGDSTKN